MHHADNPILYEFMADLHRSDHDRARRLHRRVDRSSATRASALEEPRPRAASRPTALVVGAIDAVRHLATRRRTMTTPCRAPACCAS